MEYKGYKIIADVDVNEQWEFEETAQGIILTRFIDNGGADEANIADYIILDENGDYTEQFDAYYDTLQGAKEAIDNEGARK